MEGLVGSSSVHTNANANAMLVIVSCLLALGAIRPVHGSRLLEHTHKNHHKKDLFPSLDLANYNDTSSNSSSNCNTSNSSSNCSDSTIFNVQSYGAVGDGITDDTEAFQLAWQDACHADIGTLVVPQGYSFMVQSTIFYGPCQNNGLTFQVEGTIVAPDGPDCWPKNSSSLQWLVFYRANGLILQGGGVIDGKGKNWWNLPCKPHRGPNGTTLAGPCNSPTAIRFVESTGLTMANITVKNSPEFHVRFDGCESVFVNKVTIDTPALTPNTDGIHLSGSSSVQIYNSEISNGDDCISIVTGSSNVDIQNVTCVHSHGISIGSLGNHKSWACVSNISVSNSAIKNSDNGLRIKTWQGGYGSVLGVSFTNIYVQNVRNPIIIDQFYCIEKGCHNETNAVFVSDVLYSNIKGTYDVKSPPMHFACSDVMPCTNITLENIELFPSEGQMIQDPYCWNAYGSIQTLTIPPVTCLLDGAPDSLASIETAMDKCQSY